MAILQVHQAKTLKQLHQGGSDPRLMQELRTATDFALRATKVTARSLGQVMSTMVVQERHLWLNLAQMSDADKVRFLDAPISQAGLFGDTVKDFAQQFSAVQKQTEAIKHILPRRESTKPSGARPPSARRRGRPPAAAKTPAPPSATTSTEETPLPRRRAGRKGAAPSVPPPPGGGPGGGDFAAAADLRVGGTQPLTKRAIFSVSGPLAPSCKFERRFASSGADSELVFTGTRGEGCPAQGTPGIVPLIPLVRSLAAWLSLPSPSRWLIRTVRLGYAIQFKQRPPRFRGILSTSVRSDMDASVLRAEIAVLLAKNAIELVPPAEMNSGFYSPYFIVPKKSGGLQPILDLRVLNRSLHRLPFRMLTAKRILSACADSNRQCSDGSVYQPAGWFTLPSHVATRPPSPPVESDAAQIAASRSHSGRAESCSRCAFTTAHSSRRMATPPPGGPADLESIRRGSGGPVRLPVILPLPAFLCPVRGSPRQGRAGTQLAPGSHQVRLSPSEPPCTDTVQDQGGRGAGLAGCALLAHPDLVCRPHAPHDSPSLEDSPEKGPSFSGDGRNLAPASRPLEHPCVASGRDSADLTGLPQAVIDTIIQARAPSTRQAYALKWGLFADWCSSHREDPQRCSVGVVLSFLQDKLERRLSPSTLKVYVPAIAAYHDAVDGLSLGKHHLIVRFLRGLRRAPFEPLASVELKYLSLKTSLLIALTSIKRVGDLHAFSVSESCLEFGPADSHVTLRTWPGYVPKVPTAPFRDQVVNLQALPLEEADPALSLLCPVRALRTYVDCTRSFRRSEQLFVCFGGQQMGKAVSKQRLAHWVVDAITLAYQCQGEPCPLGVRAHSTRSVASSHALAHGASLADICRAAGWATPNTFARFYNLRVEPVSSRVLGEPWILLAPSVRIRAEFLDCVRVSVPPTLASVTWHPWKARFSGLQGVGKRTTEGERLGYICNPRSLKEGTETLRSLATIRDCAGGLGFGSAPQLKSEERGLQM
ncbi:Sentrin-specific protease 2 [Labeo rohita]|uniref:Sentrin-specific protease 2 n=1 Tax=Labeo rohita TaxID=84645 RepID=A0ABQ8L5Q8_LABRO|nr:Sentrin-specific protease 2 [Labeo rohita]